MRYMYCNNALELNKIQISSNLVVTKYFHLPREVLDISDDRKGVFGQILGLTDNFLCKKYPVFSIYLKNK